MSRRATKNEKDVTVTSQVENDASKPKSEGKARLSRTKESGPFDPPSSRANMKEWLAACARWDAFFAAQRKENDEEEAKFLCS